MTRVLAAETNNFLLPNATFFVELLLFVVILFVFYRFVVPPLTTAMGERQAMVDKQVEDNREATRRLEQAEERYTEALAEARAEAARIRDEARAEAGRIRDEMREKADREVERIRVQGEDQLAEQRERTVGELRSEIGGLSTELAERIVGEPLRTDRSTVDRLLADLDGTASDDRRGSTHEPSTSGGAG